MKRPPLRDFSRSLPMALLRAREAVMRRFRASLRRHDLTEQQWRVLRALGAGGEREASDLAAATFLLGPSLSRILRDLEARALVARRTADGDQRRALLTLTKSGAALISRVAPESEAIYADIARRFGAAELERLHEMLVTLEARLTGSGVDDTEGGP